MAFVSLLLGIGNQGTRVERKVGDKTAFISLDAMVDEGFTDSVELTKHPVEKGADIADHIIERPKTLSIRGKITETPFTGSSSKIGAAASIAAAVGQETRQALGIAGSIAGTKSMAAAIQNNTSGDGESLPAATERLRGTVTEFENIKRAKTPVTIVTGLRRYENYVLINCRITRDSTTGGSINVALEFEELVEVASQNVQVAIPKQKNALNQANQGKKKGVPLEGEQGKKASLAVQGLRGLGIMGN